MRLKKLKRESGRLETLIKSYKWKWKNGELLPPEEVELLMWIYGYQKSYLNHVGEKRAKKKTYNDYVSYLQGVCDRTNIIYKKRRWL